MSCYPASWFLCGFLVFSSVVSVGQPAIAADNPERCEGRGIAGVGAVDGQVLDPEQPAPRELVLETFRQMLALPPEDQINWDKAVEAGRIPPNVQVLHEYLRDRPHEDVWDAVPPPEMRVLPDGREVEVFPVEVLGPNLGANVTQEDLDRLLPELADAHERIEAYSRTRYDDPDPWSRVRFEPEDFEIAIAYEEEQPGTEKKVLTRGEAGMEYFVERDRLLAGRHVHRAWQVTDDSGRAIMYLDFSEEGAEIIAQATREAVGGYLALMVRGELLSVPRIRAEITGGEVSITGLDPETFRAIIEEGKSRFLNEKSDRQEQ